MSESSAPVEAEKPPQAAKKSGSVWPLLALLVAAAALGVAGWQFYNTRQEMDGLRQELAKRLADVDAQSRAGRISSDQLREASKEASVKIGVLETKLAESQSQQIALEALYQDLSRNRDEWTFAEIEQTLLIANQQLQLAGNVRAALIALQAADTRLQNMDRPQLLNLRKAISEDMARLKAAPAVDTVGISARLDTLTAAVDKMPLTADARAQIESGAPPAASADTPATQPEKQAAAADTGAASAQSENIWTRFWRGIWSEARQMVRVQRVDNTDVPLLAPQQVFFLRENLKLRLLSARIALLSRDQAVFRNDLKSAHDWIKRYFDTRDKAVTNALSTLAALQKTDLIIALPDLSASLDALKLASPATARPKT